MQAAAWHAQTGVQSASLLQAARAQNCMVQMPSGGAQMPQLSLQQT